MVRPVRHPSPISLPALPTFSAPVPSFNALETPVSRIRKAMARWLA
jgi:hypothetical protein